MVAERRRARPSRVLLVDETAMDQTPVSRTRGSKHSRVCWIGARAAVHQPLPRLRLPESRLLDEEPGLWYREGVLSRRLRKAVRVDLHNNHRWAVDTQ